MKKLLVLPLALLSLTAFACNKDAIEVKNFTILAGPAGQKTTAGYATIRNFGKESCKIVAAKTPIAKEVQLHTTKREGSQFKMQRVYEFVIPAKGELQLTPGGNHLMFMGLTKPLKPGQHADVTFKFKDRQEKTFRATVQDMRNAPPHAHSGH